MKYYKELKKVTINSNNINENIDINKFSKSLYEE